MTEEFIYNDFTYRFDSEDRENIKIIHNKKKPEYIYKYYGFNSYSVDSLINNFFYASHPFDLNDKMDSSLYLLHTSEILNFNTYKNLFKGSEKEIRELYKKDILPENQSKLFFMYLWGTLFSKLGIISLSDNSNNSLMRSHYTHEKGYQLQFNFKDLTDSVINQSKPADEVFGIYPVNYSNTLAPIDIGKFKDLFIPLLYISTLKDDKWSYEEEWRILFSRNEMNVPFSKNGLTNIKDYSFPIENRFCFYKKETISSISLGMDFFNARDFDLSNQSKSSVDISVKDDNLNSENYFVFFDYILKNLSDKLYKSSIRREINDDKAILKRMKNQVFLDKLNEDTYRLNFTDTYI